MKHKILIFLLALGASTGALFAESGTCGDNLTWDLTDGVLTISGTGAMTDYANVSDVPWYNYIGGITNVVFAEGCGITSIGNRSFVYCSSLTSIAIPNSVTTIGDYAFYGCSSLASVTISNCVASIGYAAFYSCSGLTSVTIPNTVAVVGDFAFGSCSSLTSVTIPESVMTIGYGGTFQDCTALTKVQWNAKNCIIEPFDKNTNGYYAPFINDKNLVEFTFGDKVESIPSWLCAGLAGLQKVHLPNSVTSIGDMAFNGCTGLTSPVYNAHVFAYMPPSYSGAYTIPDGIESIAGHAFYRCAGLTSITIPNSVKSIGNDAFYECNNLTSVCISDLSAWCNISFENYQDVTHPLFYAEHLYLNGSEVTDLKIPDNVSTIKNYAFYWCKGLTSVTIPNSVTSIGNSAFSGCSGLTSVTIPNSVTNIGDNAFSICTGLTSVTIPNSVISIGDYAFNGCTSLTTITIPNSITHIGGRAFIGCTGLTSVTIPNSVTSIGYAAFAGCTGLTSVTCYATTPPEQLVYMVSGNYIWPFYGVDCSQIPLYVPAESIEAYKAADGWKDFSPILPIAPQGIDDLYTDSSEAVKVLRDGKIFILRRDKTYTIQGQEVK